MPGHEILFEPVRIGPVIALRAMKAEGGWGTVAMQICEIGPDSDMTNHPMERIWDETDIPSGGPTKLNS